MSDGLTRDALIEQVRGELARWPVGSGFYDMSEEVVDAVLRAVAGDLEAHKDAWIENVDYLSANGGTQAGIALSAGSAMALGVAAVRVRDLLGKDKTNE